MKYNILYYPLARSDIEGIGDYIANTLFAPRAAAELLGKIRRAIEILQDFPLSGATIEPQEGLTLPYRWLKVENYMIFYTVDKTKQTVTVMRILYGASDYFSIL